MAPTIAERATAGEALHAPDLTRQERRELLVWARDVRGMEYKEIKRKYGFKESETTLRGWYMNHNLNDPPRVANFTAEDDRLLLNAVELYAGGSLDEESSIIGIWKKTKEHIRRNGGTTSAGESKLKQRWKELTGRDGASSSRATRGTTARGAQPTSSTQPEANMEPETDMESEAYESLPEGELEDLLGKEGAAKYKRDRQKEKEEKKKKEKEKEEEYESLPEGELEDLLGKEGAAQYKRDRQKEKEEKKKKEKEKKEKEKKEKEKEKKEKEKEEAYESLSEGELEDLLGKEGAAQYKRDRQKEKEEDDAESEE